MQSGEVKFYKDDQGYGFINADDKDYFVHITDVTNARTLHEGSRVQFMPGENDRGLKAFDVKVEQPMEDESVNDDSRLEGHESPTHTTTARARVWTPAVMRALTIGVAVGFALGLGAALIAAGGM